MIDETRVLVEPAATPEETAAILAALSLAAASTAAPASETPSRWRLAARRYDAFDRERSAFSGESF
jgi:hypothetical protein